MWCGWMYFIVQEEPTICRWAQKSSEEMFTNARGYQSVIFKWKRDISSDL